MYTFKSFFVLCFISYYGIYSVLVLILPIWYPYRIGTRTNFTYLVLVLYWYSCQFYQFSTRTSAQKVNKNKMVPSGYCTENTRTSTRTHTRTVPIYLVRYLVPSFVQIRYRYFRYWYGYRYGYCTNPIPKQNHEGLHRSGSKMAILKGLGQNR